MSIFAFYTSASAQLGQNCPEDLIPRQDNKSRLYGYSNLAAEWIIPAHYVKVYPFIGNKAVVMLGTKLGVINCEGYLVIPAEYDDFTIFNVDKTWAKKAGTWSLINDKGQKLINEEMSDVHTIQAEYDFIWVKKDKLWGIFSERSFKFIAKPQFDMFQTLSEAASIVKLGDSLGVISHEDGTYFIKPNIQNIIKINKTAFAFKQAGKWGVFDDEGAIWMQPNYDTIYVTTSKLLTVRKDNQWGIIDFKEKEVLPIKFQEVGAFSNGLSKVKLNDKYGFVNQHGKTIIPIIYDTAHDYKNGNAIVMQNGKYGIIDGNNKAIAKIEFQDIVRNYSQPYYVAKKENKWSFYSISFEKIAPESFDKIFITDSSAFMRVVNNEKCQFFNLQKGNFTFGNTYQECKAFSNGFALIMLNDKWGVVNEKGILIIQTNYENIDYEYNNGKYIFFVKDKGKVGVLTQDGKQMIPIDYDLITSSDKGLFKVKKGNKYGILKSNGQVSLDFKYDYMSSGKDSVLVPEFPAIIQDGKKYGLINEKGNEILKPSYDHIKYLGENLYAFQKKKLWGLLKADGNILVEAEYQYIGLYNEKLAPVEKDGKWGYIALGGKFAIQPIFEEVGIFYKDYACVKENGKWGVIYKNGKWYRKPEFDTYLDTKDGYRVLTKDGKEHKLNESGMFR